MIHKYVNTSLWPLQSWIVFKAPLLDLSAPPPRLVTEIFGCVENFMDL